MISSQKINLCFIFLVFVGGCALVENGAFNNKLSTGLVATPINYYSTPKARYLGAKYKQNLDRIAERIVRNPKTAQLQFANNISSVGGIGFFTHSATTSPDERYLEVVVATPETFEIKGNYSDKVQRLFSLYGEELLAIIAGDRQIFDDRELRGYGLNLAWRTVFSEGGSSGIGLARAVVYFHKERVAEFLRDGLTANELLSDAVIFAVEDNGPLELVSYQARETRADSRPAIREDDLMPAAAKPAATARPTSLPRTQKTNAPAAKKELPSVAVPEQPETAVRESSPDGADKGKKEAVMRRLDEGIVASSSLEQSQLPSTPTETVSLPAREVPGGPGATGRSQIEKATSAVEAASTAVQSPKKLTGEEMEEMHPGQPEMAVANMPSSEPSAQMTGPQSKPLAPAVSSERAKESVGLKPEAESDPSETGALKIPVQTRPESSETQEAEEQEVPAQPVKTDKPETAPMPRTPVAEQIPVERKPDERVNPPDPKFSRSDGRSPVAMSQADVAKTHETAPAAAESVQTQASQREPPEAGESVRAPLPIQERVEKKIALPKSQAKREGRSEAEVPEQTGTASKSNEVLSSSVEDNASVAMAKQEVAESLEAASLASSTKEKDQSTEEKEVAPPLPASSQAPDPLAKSAMPPAVTKTPEARKTEDKDNPVFVPPIRQASPVPESAKPSASEAKTAAPATVGESKRGGEQRSENPAGDQLALLRKPAPIVVERKALPRPAPRSLEGFVIQIAFSDKDKARSWAEEMEQKGFAVSLTEAGGGGALRVRLGNFSGRDEAERQLRDFKKEGMNGIVINLPQGFRPSARASLP